MRRSRISIQVERWADPPLRYHNSSVCHPGSGSYQLRWDEVTLEGEDAMALTALSFGQIFILRPFRRINGNREDRVRITIFRMERNRS